MSKPDTDAMLDETRRILGKTKLSAKDFGKAVIYLDFIRRFGREEDGEEMKSLESRFDEKYARAYPNLSTAQSETIEHYIKCGSATAIICDNIDRVETEACYRLSMLELAFRRLDIMLLDKGGMVYNAVFDGSDVEPPDVDAPNETIAKEYFGKVAGVLSGLSIQRADTTIREQRAHVIYFDTLKEVFDLPLIKLEAYTPYIRNAIFTAKNALESVLSRGGLKIDALSGGQDALELFTKYVDTKAEDLPEDFRDQLRREAKAQKDFTAIMKKIKEEVKKIHDKQ